MRMPLIYQLLLQLFLLHHVVFCYRQPLKRVKRQMGRPLNGGGILCTMPRGTGVKGKSAKQSLCNIQDYVYIGPISIGTPAQLLYVTYDSGSADSWVMVDECRTVTCLNEDDTNTGGAVRFISKLSQTFRPSREKRLTFEYAYGGTVNGYAAQDSLCVGAGRALCLNDFDFLAGDNVEWGNRFIDGLIGLSYGSDADLKGKSLLDRLAVNGSLQEKLFAVWLNRNTSDNQDGGEITFGYTNTSRHIGKIEYFPVIEKRLWTIRLHSAWVWDSPTISNAQGNVKSLNGHTHCKHGGPCSAIFDTGTSFIEAPDNITGRLIEEWSSKGFIHRDLLGKWVLKDCATVSQLPNLVFKFGESANKSQSYVLTPKDYTFIEDPNFDGKCDLKLAFDNESPDLEHWIFGSAFMGKFYTVFDFGNDRVGLAVARH